MTDERTAPEPRSRRIGAEGAYRIVQVLILGLSVALAAQWIAVNRTPPAWDQSHYLWIAMQYVDAFHRDGPAGFAGAYFSVERYESPGYPVLVFLFMLALGSSVQAGLIANVAVWIVFLLTIAAITRRLFGGTAALIAMAATATVPLLLFLLHQTLTDLAALTWACLAVLVMLSGRQFSRWRPAALAGAFAGLGLMTKATVILFLAGPVLVISVRTLLRLREATTGERLRVVGNMLLATAVALAIALPWYLVNWGTAAYYSQLSLQAAGLGPQDPSSPRALAAFAVMVVNDASWWLVGGIGVLGGGLLLDRVLGARTKVAARSNAGGRRTWAWLLVASMLLPLAFLVVEHNQRSRFGAIVFPGLAMVFAALSQMTRPRFLRVAAVTVVLVTGLAQVGAQLPPGSDLLRSADLVLPVGSAGGIVLFAPYYPAANPAGDDATRVMVELEAVAGGRPVRVLMAQEDHVFNLYTLTWIAAERQDRFRFGHPIALTGDPAELATYQLAVYMSAPQVAQRNADPRVEIQRVAILNQLAATTVYGDRLFQVFGRIHDGVTLGDGTTVWVLAR